MKRFSALSVGGVIALAAIGCRSHEAAGAGPGVAGAAGANGSTSKGTGGASPSGGFAGAGASGSSGAASGAAGGSDGGATSSGGASGAAGVRAGGSGGLGGAAGAAGGLGGGSGATGSGGEAAAAGVASATGGSGGTAVGSGGAPAGGASPGELEVFSWWTAGVERSAVEALFTAFNPAYPDAGDGVAITFTEQPDGIVARANLQSRITAGNPPDVFQENAGKLLQDLAGTGEVASLEDLSLWSAIVPDVVEQVSRGGVPYAVPLSVARINSIFYSVDLLGAEFQPPATLAEFHALLESLKANHPEASPLSLGNGFLWTMNLLVWEMVMPAVAGATYYERFWRGDAQIGPGGVDDAALRDVLREALVLYCGVNAVDPTGLGLRSGGACDGYFNADVDTAEWEEPVRAVATGTAAMAPMGDWARNILVAAGSAPTADFGVFQFPGDDVFVWVADTLAMTSDAPNRFNARSFLELAGSKQGQIAFNVPKGSIPARNDIAPEDGLDLLSMSIVGDFTSAAARAPGRSTLGVEPAMSALSQQLRDSLRAHDMAALYQYILDSYAEVGALFP